MKKKTQSTTSLLKTAAEDLHLVIKDRQYNKLKTELVALIKELAADIKENHQSIDFAVKDEAYLLANNLDVQNTMLREVGKRLKNLLDNAGKSK